MKNTVSIDKLSDIQQLKEYDNLEFIAKQIVEGFITGMHRSPFHGFSVEFAEHRLYNAGEPTRHIDWRLYGRTDKLFVKKYEEETNLRAYMVIDNSSSMWYPQKSNQVQTKLAFSIYSAAALIHLLRNQRDAVGFALFNDKVEKITPAKISIVHTQMLYNELTQCFKASEVADASKTGTNPSKCLHEIGEIIHKRSLIVIFSDMFGQASDDDLFSALQHLRHNKHEVILFHVTDQNHEIAFDFPNRPHRFVDLESGLDIKLNPNDIKASYHNYMANFESNLKLRCGQYGIDFIQADINKGFSQVLEQYLIKRKQMH